MNMSEIDWAIKGPHLVNCNCDYGCPCQFAAPPTDGTCKAVGAWRIDEGHFGDVKLDGLIAVNTYAWPGAIHQGNGEMQSIIDERADNKQRDALAKVLKGEGGEPGSTMLWIYHAMCKTVHEPIISAIELTIDMDNRIGKLSVPGVLETAVESLKNPVTGAEHRARIDLPAGKEFRLAEVGSGTTKATGLVTLEFANSHAHFSDSTISSGGIDE
jgi:hypothetical protein